jgi:transcriptional regulator with XRE-family HTH domain
MSKDKKYNSVSAMLKDVADEESALSAAEFDQYVADRKLVKDLAILRSGQGMTQEDLAGKVGRSQSWVSKFENGTDDELSIGDLRAYMSALGLEFRPGAVKQGATLVDEIKLLSFAVKEKLVILAEMAKEGDGMVEHIAKFFGEAFHNINRFLSEAAAKLPLAPDRRPYISIVAVAEQMKSLEKEEKEEAIARTARKSRHPTQQPALN